MPGASGPGLAPAPSSPGMALAPSSPGMGVGGSMRPLPGSASMRPLPGSASMRPPPAAGPMPVVAPMEIAEPPDRLRTWLGVAIIVLMLVLAVVGLLWLRRSGIVELW